MNRNQENSHQGPSRTQRAADRHDHSDKHPEGDDDGAPDSSPSPDPASTGSRAVDPINHDMDISLDIRDNGENKGDFLRLRTTVKVCNVTLLLHLRSFSTRRSSSLFPTRKKCQTFARETLILKRTSFASMYLGRLLSLSITQQDLWDFSLIRSLFYNLKICKISDNPLPRQF